MPNPETVQTQPMVANPVSGRRAARPQNRGQTRAVVRWHRLTERHMALGCCEGIRGLVSAVSLALIANSAPSTLLAQPLPRATPDLQQQS